MARVIEWRTWSERNKYSKELVYHGYAKVDPIYETSQQLEEAVQECYRLHTQRWTKVMGKLGVEKTTQVPRHLVNELNAWLAGDLREVYGRNRTDASYVYAPKNIDMVKLAKRHNIEPGSPDWETLVIDIIRGEEPSDEE